MNGTWKSGFYYGTIKDGITGLAPYGPKVTAKTKARSREAEDARVRHVLRVQGRSTTRAASSACRKARS